MLRGLFEIEGSIAKREERSCIELCSLRELGVTQPVGSVDDEEGEPPHAAQRSRPLERDEEFCECEAVKTVAGIRGRIAPRGERVKESFSMERRSTGTVGPAKGENEVDPLFDEWRSAVPVQRMVKHDHVARCECILFLADIDVEIGIQLVQVAEGDVLVVREAGQQRTVRARLFEARMRKNDEDALHGVECTEERWQWLRGYRPAGCERRLLAGLAFQ